MSDLICSSIRGNRSSISFVCYKVLENGCSLNNTSQDSSLNCALSLSYQCCAISSTNTGSELVWTISRRRILDSSCTSPVAHFLSAQDRNFRTNSIYFRPSSLKTYCRAISPVALRIRSSPFRQECTRSFN